MHCVGPSDALLTMTDNQTRLVPNSKRNSLTRVTRLVYASRDAHTTPGCGCCRRRTDGPIGPPETLGAALAPAKDWSLPATSRIVHAARGEYDTRDRKSVV